MRAMMMDVPLSVSSILLHAARCHAATAVVSRTGEGTLHRTSYAAIGRRCARLANALLRLGVGPGEPVGTLAWNDHRHLEIYYATAGAGFVCHTVNPRLFADQVAFILDHAGERVLFVDPALLPLVESMAGRLARLEVVVVLADAARMPAASASRLRLLCYEELLAAEADRFEWPELDERAAAALCYTSGTTGQPKGVLYSHRSIVLHAMASCLPDAFGLSAQSVVMPVVPMFHVNAWGLPYAAVMVGAKLVLPGPRLDGASLQALVAAERVTFAAGVPTVWMALLDWADANNASLAPLRRVLVGGSACSPVLFERFRARGVALVHAWGMTETSPIGLVNAPKADAVARTPDQEAAFAAKQGRPLFGIQLRVVDQAGAEVAQDGMAFGDMQVRGPWVASGYHGAGPDDAHASPGWFATGDVATIDPDGFVQIVDRSKDVIKSGGEWISSIAIENLALAHPAVQEAACVARPDPRWGERPLLVVVARPGMAVTKAQIVAHLEGQVARWWIPDHVVVADELPHTATGKLLKTRIRELYCLPAAEARLPR